PHRGAEADEVLRHAHAEPLRGQQVADLVQRDRDYEADGDREDTDPEGHRPSLSTRERARPCPRPRTRRAALPYISQSHTGLKETTSSPAAASAHASASSREPNRRPASRPVASRTDHSTCSRGSTQAARAGEVLLMLVLLAPSSHQERDEAHRLPVAAHPRNDRLV